MAGINTLMMHEHNKNRMEKGLKMKKIWSPKDAYLNCFVAEICTQAVQLPLFEPLVDTVPKVIFGWNSGVSKSYYHTLNLLFFGPKHSRLTGFWIAHFCNPVDSILLNLCRIFHYSHTSSEFWSLKSVDNIVISATKTYSNAISKYEVCTKTLSNHILCK